MIGNHADLYGVLGLTPQATQAQVRRAYRSLLRQNHPDTRAPGNAPGNAAADAVLQRAIAAYAVLGDPDLRAGYDQRSTERTPVEPAPLRWGRRFPSCGPETSPLRAGPVRWHPSE